MRNVRAAATRLAAEIAELGVELNRQDDTARARSAEDFRVAADRPARQVKARHDLALNAYIGACGYDREVRAYLRAAMTATDGHHGFRRCADWRMGAYLAGYPDAEIKRLEAAPNDDTVASREKASLAKTAQRAGAALDDEQRRTGIVSVRRKPGNRPGGKRLASEVDTPFVQYLVEIDREAKGLRGVRRLERYERAAASVVARLPRNVRPSRAEEQAARHRCPACGDSGVSCPDHERGARTTKGKTPASRGVLFLAKLEQLAERVAASGDDLPYEARLELFDSAIGLLAQKLGIDPSDAEPRAAESDAHSSDGVFEIPAKNRDPHPSSRDKNVQLEGAATASETVAPTGPDDSETPLFIEAGERLYWQKRDKGLGHDQALGEARREMGSFNGWKAARLHEVK